jgi:hypothetical protein
VARDDAVDMSTRSAQLAETLEKVEREVAFETATAFAKKHIDILTEIRERNLVDDSELLSERIVAIPKISAQMKREVSGLRNRLRTAILTVAVNIEERKYRGATQIAKSTSGMKQRQIASSIVNSEKRLHISVQSLQVTVDVFNILNDQILEYLDKDRRKFFANAVLISELASFLIEYIKAFQVDGLMDILALHKERLVYFKQIRADIDRSRRQLADSRISEEERALRAMELQASVENLDEIERSWSEWVRDYQGNVKWVQSVRDLIPALEARRDVANIRLKVLQELGILARIRENAMALRETTLTISQLKLAPLPNEKLMRLISD